MVGCMAHGKLEQCDSVVRVVTVGVPHGKTKVNLNAVRAVRVSRGTPPSERHHLIRDLLGRIRFEVRICTTDNSVGRSSDREDQVSVHKVLHDCEPALLAGSCSTGSRQT
jgi:hypothetical protein